MQTSILPRRKQLSTALFDSNDGHWKNSALPQQWQESADQNLNDSEFNRILEYCIRKLPSKLVPVFIAKYIDDADAEDL